MIAPLNESHRTYATTAQGDTRADEAALIAQLRLGDRRASDAFVRRYEGMMFSVAKRILRCEHEALDAVQDALLAALGGLATFNGDSRLRTWLHRIVVNTCLMRLRSRRTGGQAFSLDAFPHAFERPDSTDLTAHEVREHVHARIAQLPEHYRAVIALRDIEELDTDETAQRLCINRANVKTRLHRARAALRELLR